MPADAASVRAEVGRLLRERPAQATTLCIERFLAIPAEEVPAEVLDQLIADGGPGHTGHRRPGRALRWRDHAGRELAGIEVHPVRPDFEDAFLPHAFAAIAGAPLALELRCDTETLLDGRVVVERWDGRDILSRSVLDPIAAESVSPGEQALLGQLEGLGAEVAIEPGAIVVRREHSSRAQPWLLAFFPLLIWLVPFLLVFARGVLWNYFDRALKTRRYRLSFRFEPQRVQASYEGEGEETRSVELATDDVVAVSFAPTGCTVDPETKGTVRVVGRRAVVHVPADLPGLPTASQQAMGRALKELLQAAGLRART